MTHIRVKRGLRIPLSGHPDTSSTYEEIIPQQFSIDFRLFRGVNLRVLVQEGQSLPQHSPVVEVKDNPDVRFLIPVSGVVKEIRRGEKRRLLEIVFHRDTENKTVHDNIQLKDGMSRDELINALSNTGLITRFFQRPFSRPVVSASVNPPRSCFVRAVDLRPFAPSIESSISGLELFFKKGLEIISGLFESQTVHVVTYKNSPIAEYIPYQTAKCVHHTVEGNYPACSSSLHIQEIDPIVSANDSVWIIEAIDVTRIGFFAETGSLDMPILISRAGDGFIPSQQKYVRTREGASLRELISETSMHNTDIRLISGDPLNGNQVDIHGFLQRGHSVISAIPEHNENNREFLHFFRLGSNKYTATKAYYSGHQSIDERKWHFTTNLHGEERPFIDGSVYENVVPLNVFPMQLIKALLAEDYDLAMSHGLLDVSKEDFALPEFICPSKIPMMDIIEDGLERCRQDLIGN